MLNKKVFGGNLAIKVDIKKTFDTLDRNFLLEVLTTFGFSKVFSNWILAILQSARLSFDVNGASMGQIPCKRGVRQGDPLFSLLFCLAEDVLSKGISCLVENHHLLPMAGPKGYLAPTHAFL